MRTIQNAQALLEASLLARDLAQLAEIIEFADSQNLPARVMDELYERRSSLRKARDEFLSQALSESDHVR